MALVGLKLSSKAHLSSLISDHFIDYGSTTTRRMRNVTWPKLSTSPPPKQKKRKDQTSPFGYLLLYLRSCQSNQHSQSVSFSWLLFLLLQLLHLLLWPPWRTIQVARWWILFTCLVRTLGSWLLNTDWLLAPGSGVRSPGLFVEWFFNNLCMTLSTDGWVDGVALESLWRVGGTWFNVRGVTFNTLQSQ